MMVDEEKGKYVDLDKDRYLYHDYSRKIVHLFSYSKEEEQEKNKDKENENQSVLVGSLKYEITAINYEKMANIYINQIEISPQYRKRGLASLLLDVCFFLFSQKKLTKKTVFCLDVFVRQVPVGKRIALGATVWWNSRQTKQTTIGEILFKTWFSTMSSRIGQW